MPQVIDDLHVYRPTEDGGPEPDDPQVFGPAAADFWILDGGRIPWLAYADQLDSLFSSPPGELFISYQVWWPGVEAKKRAFRDGISGTVSDVNGTLVAGVTPVPSMRTVLTTRIACGAENSGLWLLISPRAEVNNLSTRLRSQEAVGSPLQVAWGVLDEALVVLALDEGAWGTLLVRRDHPARSALLDLFSMLLPKQA